MVGAIRGPGIPRGHAKGITTYEKHHATDWLPTLVAMASRTDWSTWTPAQEPPYLAGDGVNNWPMLQAGGAAGSSARDWLLYETHPEGGHERDHGDAFVLGDLKIIRTAQTNPKNSKWMACPSRGGSESGPIYNC